MAFEVAKAGEEFAKLSPAGKVLAVGGVIAVTSIAAIVLRQRMAAGSGSSVTGQQQALQNTLGQQGNAAVPPTFDINQLASAVAAALAGTGSIITGPPGPAGPPGSSVTVTKNKTHTVQSGETVQSIAQQYGLTVAQFEALPGNYTAIIKNGSGKWSNLKTGITVNVAQ